MPLRAAAFEILRKYAVLLRKKGLLLNGVQKVVSSNLTAPTIFNGQSNSMSRMIHSGTSCRAFLNGAFCSTARLLGASSNDAPQLVTVKRMWDSAPHNAFSDLTRFEGKLSNYSSHEGETAIYLAKVQLPPRER